MDCAVLEMMVSKSIWVLVVTGGLFPPVFCVIVLSAGTVEMDGAMWVKLFQFPTAGACLSHQLSLDQLIMMAYL